MMAPRRGARMRGVGVIELMIALTLGLLVMLIGSVLLIGSNSGYLQHTEVTRLDDSGRYALATLTGAIRQTAFVNWDRGDAPAGAQAEDSANIAGLDARSVNRAGDGIDAAPANAVNGSDVLALRYFGAGSGASGDGSVLNCAGFGVGAAASEAERGWSIFYVAVDADGEAELRCKYRGASSWGADAIVRGVDTFQVLYGLDTDQPPDGVANRYVNASEIAGLDAAQAVAGEDAAARNRKTYWKRVVSLKVSLLLHGERGSAMDAAPQRFDLFGAEYSDAYGGSDVGVRIDEQALPAAQRGRSRRLLRTTVTLRNRAE